MKKVLLIVFLFMVSKVSLGQNSYPIQTILKGDSVVIYTVEQSIDLDLMLENQRALSLDYKKKNEEYRSKIDSLERLVKIKSEENDSLLTLNRNQDSLKQRLHIIEDWLVRSSIDNAYIYMSWPDSKIKSVDLSIYTVHGNHQNGTLRMVRRGPNNELQMWKSLNYIKRESPSVDWNKNYYEEDMPIINNLPIDIKINNYIQ